MASGDVVLEFTSSQLSTFIADKTTVDSTGTLKPRYKTPQTYLFTGNTYNLPNEESFASAEVEITGTYNSKRTTGNSVTDADRTGYRNLFDGTKRYKITITEV